MIEKVSTFKERFNEALSVRGIKPIELSEKTGLSESTISQYRSGYAKPKDDKLVLLSNVLGVNPVWLMGLNVPMDEEESVSIDYDTEKLSQAMNLYNAYLNVPENIRQSIDLLMQSAQQVSQTVRDAQLPTMDVEKPRSIPYVKAESEKPRAEIPYLKKDKK